MPADEYRATDAAPINEPAVDEESMAATSNALVDPDMARFRTREAAEEVTARRILASLFLWPWTANSID